MQVEVFECETMSESVEFSTVGGTGGIPTEEAVTMATHPQTQLSPSLAFLTGQIHGHIRRARNSIVTLRSVGRAFPTISTIQLLDALRVLVEQGQVKELIGPGARLYWVSTAVLEKIR